MSTLYCSNGPASINEELSNLSKKSTIRFNKLSFSVDKPDEECGENFFSVVLLNFRISDRSLNSPLSQYALSLSRKTIVYKTFFCVQHVHPSQLAPLQKTKTSINKSRNNWKHLISNTVGFFSIIPVRFSPVRIASSCAVCSFPALSTCKPRTEHFFSI